MLADFVASHDSSKFELVLVLTGDHTTPVSIGDHTFETVPFSITTVSALQAHFSKPITNPKCREYF